MHRGAHRRPRVAVAERHIAGQRHRNVGAAAARPAATTGAARLRGRRRGTGRRARRRSWAGSPPSHRARPGPASLSSGTTAACSIRSRGWLPAERSAARVTTSCAAVTQCTATGPPALMPVDDPRGELVRGRVGHRAGCAFPGARQMHPLPQPTVSMRLHQLDDVAGTEVRGGVGDAGDAVSGQPPAQVREVDFALPQRIRPSAVRRCAAGRRGDRAAPPGPAPPSSGSTARRCGAARAPVVCGTRRRRVASRSRSPATDSW